MRSVLLTSLPVLLLAACTGAADDSGGNGGDNGGNGGDNGGGGGGCGDYNPGVGSVLTYTYVNMGGVTGTYVLTFTSYDAGTGAAVFTSTSAMTGNGYSANSTVVQNLSCESDGVYAVSLTTDSEIVSGGTPFYTASETTYDPPMLLIPSTLAAGSTWDMSTSATTVDDVNGTATTSISQTATAGSSESVTVPAGTYDTLPITYTPTSGAESHTWLATGIGAVKTDYSELSSAQ